MTMIYYVTLAVGGTFVLVSIVLGGEDGDAEAEGELELDHDVDHDLHHGGDHGELDHGLLGHADAWLPFLSMRFWTFFAAFFGLTGTALTHLDLGGTRLTVGLLSGGMGYLAGLGMTKVMRRLREEVVDSTLAADDYLGEQAQVMVPIGPGKVGKIRMTIKDRVVEVLAETEEQSELALKETVFVYAIKADGVVQVSRTKQLES